MTRKVSTPALLKLLDSFIIVTLLAFAAGASFSYYRLNRFVAISREIVTHLKTAHITKIAIPIEMRKEVSHFLNNGITPLLYDPETAAPQLFAFHEVSYLLIDAAVEDERIASFAKQKQKIGSYDLLELALDNALRSPLLPGQSIPKEYSRPYIYIPLKNSRSIKNKEGVSYQYFLAPGKYLFSLEAFNKKSAGELTVVVTENGVELTENTFKIRRLADYPFEVSFEVPKADYPIENNRVKEIEIRLRIDDRSGITRVAYLHRVELKRL